MAAMSSSSLYAKGYLKYVLYKYTPSYGPSWGVGCTFRRTSFECSIAKFSLGGISARYCFCKHQTSNIHGFLTREKLIHFYIFCILWNVILWSEGLAIVIISYARIISTFRVRGNGCLCRQCLSWNTYSAPPPKAPTGVQLGVWAVEV